MRWLTFLLLVAVVLSGCGTAEQAADPLAAHAPTGQEAYPLPYPGISGTATVEVPPENALPAVSTLAPATEVPILAPSPEAPTQVMTLTTDPALWQDFTLTTVFTDDTATFGYALFGWSAQSPTLLLTKDTILGVLDVETGVWTEIKPDAPVVEAKWSPRGDQVAYISMDEFLYTGHNTYTLWLWDAASGSHKLLDIPLKLTGSLAMAWKDDHNLRIIFDAGIFNYRIESNAIQAGTIAFSAPAEYMQHTPGLSLVEPEPNALMVLAPDGIHGIIIDKDIEGSSKGFINDNSIIKTIESGVSSGYYKWSQDSSLIAIPFLDNKFGVYNSQGDLKYTLSYEIHAIDILSIAGWSPDNQYIVYRVKDKTSTDAYIAKIGETGRIKLNTEEMIYGGVGGVIWSNTSPYIAYAMNRDNEDHNGFINKLVINKINK